MAHSRCSRDVWYIVGGKHSLKATMMSDGPGRPSEFSHLSMCITAPIILKSNDNDIFHLFFY